MHYKNWLLILMLSGVFSSCLLFQPGFRKIWAENSQNTYDAVVVPGIPFEPPTFNGIMKARVYWAVWLYKKGITKNIIFSGAAVHTPYVEAEIMGMYAEKLGVPRENIHLETKAEHGSENLYYGVKQGMDLGFENIALATDPYQGALMFKHNKKFNLNIPYLPAMFDTVIALDWPIPEIDYQQAYQDSFVPISERLTRSEQFKNSMGRRIKRALKEEERAEKRAKKKAKSK